MKKKFVYPLLAFMSLSFLAGCSPSNPSGFSVSVAPSSTESSVSESKESSKQDSSKSESTSVKEESSSASSSQKEESSSESRSASSEQSASESSSSQKEESSSSSSINYTYREEVSKEPTCEEPGVKSFICNEDATRSYTEPIPALGHLYDVSALQFVWNGYESASVVTPCIRCGKEKTFAAEITSEIIKEATCTETGEKKYTATVTINNGTYSNTKTETLPGLGHIYTKVEEESFASTYAADGKLVEKCSRCDDKKETPIAKQRDNLEAYGSEENPYVLASLEDWNAFAIDAATNSFKDKYIKLTDNIGSAEAPISTYVDNYGAMFAGTFLGNEKTLYVNLPVRLSSKNAKERTGLFAFASGASFKNVIIEGIVGQDEEGSNIAAALLADGRGTIAIDNCVNKASVYAKGTAAGLLGFACGGSSITITNSRNEGIIYATGNIAGGIVGNAEGKSLNIVGTSNSGTISALKTNCSQIVGRIKTSSAVTVDESCQELGHAYYRSERSFDEAGHYYPCIEEGCRERFETEKHSYNLVDEVPATCTSTGIKSHYTCPDCSGLFVKIDDRYALTTAEDLIIPVAEHSYGEDYHFDEAGHWKVCTVCGAESEHVAHVKDYEAATEEHGITCKVCGFQMEPALSHTHKFDNVTAETKASYATEGHLAYATCSCGKIFGADSHEETTLDALKLAAQKDDAEKGYGDSEENPYLIANEADYAAFTEAVNSGTTFEGKFVKMSMDIGNEENPITTRIGSSSTNAFKGTFDGDGHSVYLGINATASYYGMFGYVSGGTIKNVVTKGTLTTKTAASVANRAGAVVAYATASIIDSCKNFATITITDGVGDVGGIAGATTSNTQVLNSENYGSIACKGKAAKYVGGIVGDALGVSTITNCVNGYAVLPEGSEQGTITNVFQFVGGILGGAITKVTIDSCKNYMDIDSSISGNAGVGGIVGLINKNSMNSEISNSSNHGNLSGLSSVGGIIGRLAAKGTSADPYIVTIKNCSSAATLSKVGDMVASEDIGSTANTDDSKKIPGILVGSTNGSTSMPKIVNE